MTPFSSQGLTFYLDQLSGGQVKKPAEGSNVIWHRDEQSSGQHLAIDSRPSIVGTIICFYRLNQFRKVVFLVYLHKKMIRINEIPESLGGELKQGRLSSVLV